MSLCCKTSTYVPLAPENCAWSQQQSSLNFSGNFFLVDSWMPSLDLMLPGSSNNVLFVFFFLLLFSNMSSKTLILLPIIVSKLFRKIWHTRMCLSWDLHYCYYLPCSWRWEGVLTFALAQRSKLPYDIAMKTSVLKPHGINRYFTVTFEKAKSE